MVKVGQWPIACRCEIGHDELAIIPYGSVHDRAQISPWRQIVQEDDAASEMFLTVTGTFLVREIGVELPPGRLIRQLRFPYSKLAENRYRRMHRRRASDRYNLSKAARDLISNPQLGYFFLVLTGQRLLENISRLDGILAQERAARQAQG